MLSKIGKWYSELFLYKGTLNLTVIARIALFLMMLVNFMTVIFRKMFPAFGWKMGPGIAGAYEYTQVLMVVLAGCAAAYAWYTNGHIRIGLFRDNMRPRLRALWDAIVALIASAYMFIVVWGLFLKSGGLIASKVETPIAQIPYPPFAIIAVILLAHFFLVLLRSSIGLFSKSAGKEFAKEPYLQGQ